jgi:hypothetical protein
MLSQGDRRRLQDIESHLEADDPAFVARMRAPLGRRRVRLLFAGDMLLWMSVPLVGAVAGWVVAAVTVAALTGATVGLWWRLQK